MLGGYAEMRIELFDGTGGAEARHADEDAILTNEAVPVAAHGRLDGDTDLLASEHLLLVRLALLFEELHRGHRDDAGGDAGLVEQSLGIERDRDFRARC